ncbi:MAG TPA: hypothetical protein VKX39_00735 [Bryobacteraceae bacterium]|jgi:sugar phosphate isomerase/epimerase|nr:hypothetical protein [Bryobacteraceae bacterium]
MTISRREFVSLAASAAVLKGQKRIPIGLQQTAVGKNIHDDLEETIRAVGKMGYDIIEFSASTFMSWTPARAREVRAMLDGAGLRCRSTHNEIASFTGDGTEKAIELNSILGSNTLVSVRGPGPVGGRGGPPAGLDAWKAFSDQLSAAMPKIRAAKMTLGFHNHEIEFQPLEGTRPIDVLTANRDITSFHLNVGLCLKGGGDPVGFMKRCPHRVQSLLIQDYQHRANWKEIFAAAEARAGLQFYLIQRTDGLSFVERQGGDLLQFAQQDLADFRKLHG